MNVAKAQQEALFLPGPEEKPRSSKYLEFGVESTNFQNIRTTPISAIDPGLRCLRMCLGVRTAAWAKLPAHLSVDKNHADDCLNLSLFWEFIMKSEAANQHQRVLARGQNQERFNPSVRVIAVCQNLSQVSSGGRLIK